jgi:hypothetical protein
VPWYYQNTLKKGQDVVSPYFCTHTKTEKVIYLPIAWKEGKWLYYSTKANAEKVELDLPESLVAEKKVSLFELTSVGLKLIKKLPVIKGQLKFQASNEVVYVIEKE